MRRPGALAPISRSSTLSGSASSPASQRKAASGTPTRMPIALRMMRLNSSGLRRRYCRAAARTSPGRIAVRIDDRGRDVCRTAHSPAGTGRNRLSCAAMRARAVRGLSPVLLAMAAALSLSCTTTSGDGHHGGKSKGTPGGTGGPGAGSGSGSSPGTPTPVAISAGGGHSCVLRGTGVVLCWGANDKGQLGDGTTKGHERPSVVGSLPPVIGLAAAGSRTCGF
ncbi:MAG: hypothetical protein KC457_09720, partial [Myxococcales bacterium]|nr:hypothetical protein [Myxococcales bacterium]